MADLIVRVGPDAVAAARLFTEAGEPGHVTEIGGACPACHARSLGVFAEYLDTPRAGMRRFAVRVYCAGCNSFFDTGEGFSL